MAWMNKTAVKKQTAPSASFTCKYQVRVWKSLKESKMYGAVVSLLHCAVIFILGVAQSTLTQFQWISANLIPAFSHSTINKHRFFRSNLIQILEVLVKNCLVTHFYLSHTSWAAAIINWKLINKDQIKHVYRSNIDINDIIVQLCTKDRH